MSDIEKMITAVISCEGGYVNYPAERRNFYFKLLEARPSQQVFLNVA